MAAPCLRQGLLSQCGAHRLCVASASLDCSLRLLVGCSFNAPADYLRKILLKSFFVKVTNFTCNFVEKSFFPGDLEGAKSLEKYEK